MKKLPKIALSAMFMMLLAGCTTNTPTSSSSSANPSSSSTTKGSTASSSSTPDSTPSSASSSSTTKPSTSSSSSKPTVTVTSVRITGYDSTQVMDNSSLTLKAEVEGSAKNLRVNWSTSNEQVATVTNGIVRFKGVAADSEVTITATSRDDQTKFDSVTFQVKHGIINTANSRGSIDTSMIFEDGTITTDIGDTALLFADVYGTRWYVETTITINEFLETENYPKIGLMTGTDSNGFWNGLDMKNYFFYIDALKAQSSWTNFNFVAQNEAGTDWDWGHQKAPFTVAGTDKAEKGMPFKMGLLRDGADYFLFAEKTVDGEKQMYAYAHTNITDIAADEPSYAWIGGWSTSYTISDYRALVGEQVDGMYGEVTEINLPMESTVLFTGESYKLNATTNTINYDYKNLKFSSNNETVATVDKDGNIQATNTPGKAVITVSYGSLSKEFTVEVTDDAKFKVDIDGKMDDLIWSEEVKNNKFHYALNGEGEYIDFYAAKNSKGVYIYADYYVNEQKSGNTSGNWWENDNFEFRFKTVSDRTVKTIEGLNTDATGGQGWVSGNKTSNLTKYYVSTPEVLENGKSHLVFELFSSYEDLQRRGETVNKNTPIGFQVGSNPASGWKACQWWDSNDFSAYPKITEDGFQYTVDETLICPTGEHDYTNWTVEQKATCTADGTEGHHCRLCGHHETRVIQSNGSHTYDESQITVVTPATCIAEGKGTVKCTSCGEDVEVTLPIDYSNHSGKYENGEWTCCHERLEKAVEFNYPAGKNWITNNYILGVMQNDADWTVEVDVDMVRTNGEKDAARGWAGQIQVENDDGTFDDKDAHKWCWRQDWWGWGYYNLAPGADQSVENKEGNCGVWDESAFDNGFNDYKDSVLDNCNLKQTISYSHETGVVTIVTIVTAKAGSQAGKHTTITYTSRAFPSDKKVEVAFGMLWNMEGTHKINSVKLTGNVVEGPHVGQGVGLVA